MAFLVSIQPNLVGQAAMSSVMFLHGRLDSVVQLASL